MKTGRFYFRESLDMALVSLWSNKLRTFLTLLGIIIGVLTIIAVVSVIQGLNDYVYTKMSFYGANDFAVSKFSPFISTIQDYTEQMKRKDLTLDDMKVLRKLCQSCELVGASVDASRNVKYGNRTIKDVSIRGVTSVDHLIGNVLELEQGRYFTQGEEDRSRYVCIIGADVAENLFPGLDPIGRWIKIG
ncbi:MAG: ABC transporter permease, partial [Candidatus Saccharicenans sp.]|nr:ABC transporter permease [Candidatus Saccharicenans sp.]